MSSSNKVQKFVTAALVAVLMAAGWYSRPALAQTANLLFGSYMGAAKALTATTNGYLNVVVAGGGLSPCPGDGTTYIDQVATNDIGFYTNGTACASGVLRFDVSATATNVATLPITGVTSLTVSTALHSPQIDNGASGAIQIGGASGGSVTFSGVGPHAIGGVAGNDAQMYQHGAFTGITGTGRAYLMQPSLALAVGQGGRGLDLDLTFIEAASGNHALLSTQFIGVATVTPGAATVTNTASLYITGAMSATVSGANYAAWIASGAVRFDGTLQSGTLVGVSCAAGTVTLLTEVVTNGIVTHC
jgi:hypothetical protein